MPTIPQLFIDLTLILTSGAIASLLCRFLRQPTILGYLVAGVLLSPRMPSFPSVGDSASIDLWGKIGVVFLLFSIGLEFSFKKLARVASASIVIALLEITTVGLMAYGLATLFGLSGISRIFFAAALAISSTTIIARCFDELHIRTQRFARVVMGILVFEDLVAVLILTVLAALSLPREAHGFELMRGLGTLVLFLIVLFVAGIFFLPTLFRSIQRYLTEETSLMVALALCFSVTVAAVQVGLSAELGAFMIGALISETLEGRRIEESLRPLKSLFASIFFVSVGMHVDPAVLTSHPWSILLMAGFVIGAKLLANSLAGVAVGFSLSTAIQIGVSLGQIGEFSFIIAGLGLTLGVMPQEFFQLLVATSIITAFTTPVLVQHATALSLIASRWFPKLDERVSTSEPKISNASRLILRDKSIRVIVNASLVIFLTLFTDLVLKQTFLSNWIPAPFQSWIGFFVSLTVSCPFLWALTFDNLRYPFVTCQEETRVARIIVISIFIFRAVLSFVLITWIAAQFLPSPYVILATLVVMILVGPVFSRTLARFYGWFEHRFVEELHSQTPSPISVAQLLPWKAHLATLEIDPNSDIVGIPLMELKLRERFGVTIAVIRRGDRYVIAPGPSDRLLPFDEIQVLGTDDQLKRFEEFLVSHLIVPVDAPEVEFSLEGFTVSADSPLIGKSLRESGVREATNGLIVGIERGAERFLNPDSSLRFEAGDRLWIVGRSEKLDQLQFDLEPLG